MLNFEKEKSNAIEVDINSLWQHQAPINKHIIVQAVLSGKNKEVEPGRGLTWDFAASYAIRMLHQEKLSIKQFCSDLEIDMRQQWMKYAKIADMIEQPMALMLASGVRPVNGDLFHLEIEGHETWKVQGTSFLTNFKHGFTVMSVHLQEV